MIKTIIKRALLPHLLEDAKTNPVLAILGPRQSGKTTLARAAFSEHTYISLEDLDNRAFAKTDPRGFLKKYKNDAGLILDEVQHVPDIISYIQTDVDLNYKPGYYVLTGSQNFLLNETITQSLAGRVSLHTLLPLSIEELKAAQLLPSYEQLMYSGCYPILYSRDEKPHKWYRDYILTYVERDVRTLTTIGDLDTFQRFMQLCAGRIGQLVNLTSLGNDCGISYNTAKAWLSVLQASYIIFFLQPHSNNLGKRVIKSPKLYFYDTGLACSLLGIENKEQLVSHYLRGGLFEALIISDLFKEAFNTDRKPNIYFWRDKTGHEVDCIIERGMNLYPVEIKAGMTINQDYFDNLSFWNEQAEADPENGFVVYGGTETQERSLGTIVSWSNLQYLYKKIG